MYRWTIIFLAATLLEGFLGFTNIGSSGDSIAKILFFVFALLFVLSFLYGARIIKREKTKL